LPARLGHRLVRGFKVLPELDPVIFGVLETRESAFAFSVYRARDRGGFDASGVQ